jgi:hypothetical protein
MGFELTDIVWLTAAKKLHLKVITRKHIQELKITGRNDASRFNK